MESVPPTILLLKKEPDLMTEPDLLSCRQEMPRLYFKGVRVEHGIQVF